MFYKKERIKDAGRKSKTTDSGDQKVRAENWLGVKSYKLKKDVVEEYSAACKKAGVSAAGQLTKMMKEFIDEVNNE